MEAERLVMEMELELELSNQRRTGRCRRAPGRDTGMAPDTAVFRRLMASLVHEKSSGLAGPSRIAGLPQATPSHPKPRTMEALQVREAPLKPL